MQPEKSVWILWDSSQIWGLMAWRALRALNLPCRLVKAQEIADGAFLGKGAAHSATDISPPKLLLVPGGSARRKADALGAKGQAELRAWITRGGNYLGFCGGAGLALSAPDNVCAASALSAQSQESNKAFLGICPWTRAEYPKRQEHFVSGHLLAHLYSGFAHSWVKSGGNSQKALLPVWWPGRFAPQNGKSAQPDVLADYAAPGPDLWLGDLRFSEPGPERNNARAGKSEQDLYADSKLDFLHNQPLVLAGRYGQGAYLLSYAHLETPESGDANQWLAQILAHFTGREIQPLVLPPWDLAQQLARRNFCEEIFYGEQNFIEQKASLEQSLEKLVGLFCHAEELGLFFRRNSWLWGWQSGLPGAACNNLNAVLAELCILSPTTQSKIFWRRRGKCFCTQLALFLQEARAYLDACAKVRECCSRLCPATQGNQDVSLPPTLLKEAQRLFGHPMRGGGLIGEIFEIAEELIFLSAT